MQSPRQVNTTAPKDTINPTPNQNNMIRNNAGGKTTIYHASIVLLFCYFFTGIGYQTFNASNNGQNQVN